MLKPAQHGTVMSHPLVLNERALPPPSSLLPPRWSVICFSSLSQHSIDQGSSLQSAEAFILNYFTWEAAEPVDHCSCHSLWCAHIRFKVKKSQTVNKNCFSKGLCLSLWPFLLLKMYHRSISHGDLGLSNTSSSLSDATKTGPVQQHQAQ